MHTRTNTSCSSRRLKEVYVVSQNENEYLYWCDYVNFGKTIGSYFCSSHTVSIFSNDDLDKLDVLPKSSMELTN